MGNLRNWGWFVVIQKTRPLIGQPNPQEELRLLEEKCKETYGAYEEALNVTKQLEEDNVKIKEETAALNAELASKSGDLAVYQQRQAAALEIKAKAEEDLAKCSKNWPLKKEKELIFRMKRRGWKVVLVVRKRKLMMSGWHCKKWRMIKIAEITPSKGSMMKLLNRMK